MVKKRNIMLDNLKKYTIFLASGSPRRRQLLADLGIDFEVRCLNDIDESYPDDMPADDVAEYISQKKAAAYKEQITGNELYITATRWWCATAGCSESLPTATKRWRCCDGCRATCTMWLPA